jgi:hypothetical protein
MALFDNNPIQSLFAPVKSGIGGLFEGMTPFGSTIPGGILNEDQEAKLRNQALVQGILGTAATYLATPKNLNAGSPLPYIGKAVLGGMGASQDVIDRAIRAKLLAGRDDTFTNINPLDVTPESLKAYIEGGKKDPSVLRRAAPIEKQETTETIKNYNEARKGGYTGSFVDFINLNKREGLNINLGQPMTAINPKTGKEELVQFPNKPGEKPIFTGLQKPEPELKLKPVPAGPATAFSENNTAIKKIDDAIAKVEAAPDNAFGLKNYLGGAVTQRIDPKGNEARAAVAGVGGQKYHDLSGAAVAVQEAARLSPYIPQVTDTKSKVLENLRNLKKEYTYTNDTLTSTFNEDQGYRPLNVRRSESAQPTSTTKSATTSQQQNVPTPAQQNRAYIGNRAIIVKGNKWVYEDTGEVAQ